MTTCKKKNFYGCHCFFIAGCQNTLAKGGRYCDVHKEVAKEYFNDDDGVGKVDPKSQKESAGLLIVKVLNEKSTRQGKMFEVPFSWGFGKGNTLSLTKKLTVKEREQLV